MSISSINEYLSNLNKHSGISRTDRFYVQIYPPAEILNLMGIRQARDLIFQCDTSDMLTQELKTSEYRITGPARKIAVVRDYQDITLSFIVTNDYYERPFFESWFNYINPPESGWNFRYKNQYTSTVDIVKMGLTSNEEIYRGRLINAFPRSMSSSKLNWQMNDAEPEKLEIIFTFDRYISFKNDDIISNLGNNIQNDYTYNIG